MFYNTGMFGLTVEFLLKKPPQSVWNEQSLAGWAPACTRAVEGAQSERPGTWVWAPVGTSQVQTPMA